MGSYKETLDYFYQQLPMFTRVGEAAYKPDLNNTLILLEAVGNPHHQLQCIHVAGTNGKGSTSNMLAAILQCAGYKTGLYTSPHLLDFRERIRINGHMIPKKTVVAFADKYKELFQSIKPSFFEMTVALCFDYFAKQKVDVAVIETGLGGRLDSTNVITPLLSIITNIGLDHTNLLGDTVEKIAFEKAGIIKPGIPVVIGETDPKTKAVFLEKAAETQSEIIFADRHIKTHELQHYPEHLILNVKDNSKPWFEKLRVSLAGKYQLKNTASTLQSVKLLRKHFKISDKDIKAGLGSVQKHTGFAGRWQVIQKKPLVIVDTGHNAHGLSQSLKQLKEEGQGTLHFVFGVVRDKKLEDIMPLLPKNAQYYLCAPALPRALPVEELNVFFAARKLIYESYPNVKQAYKAALAVASKKDIVFAGGSTFVVAEILEYLQQRKK
jgi:dihydrofolate synthase/folylpolyglutamate synthase